MEIYFLKLQIYRFLRFFLVKPFAKFITLALFLGLFSFIALGIFRFFQQGLLYVDTFPFFAEALLLYMNELFLLLIMLLVWFSSVVAVLFRLFKDKTAYWIIATPNYSIFPKSLLLSHVFSSVWVLLIILLPASVAMYSSGHLSFLPSVIAIFSSLVFSVILIIWVFLLTLFFGKALSLINRHLLGFRSIMLLHLLFFFCLISWIANRFARSDLFKLLFAQDLTALKAPIDLVTELFYVFPTHYLAKIYMFAQNGSFQNLLLGFSSLVGLLVISYALFTKALKSWFLLIWQAMAENQTELFSPHLHKRKPTFLLNSHFGLVIYKETLNFTRRTSNLFWFIFLVLLWFSHIAIQIYLQRLLLKYELLDTRLPLLVSVLPLAVLVYFLASLVLRFAFPSFSEEKNTAWILMASPIKKSSIVLGKFLFYFSIFAILALFSETLALNIGLINNLYAFEVMLLAILAVFFLTALGVSVGATFPNFETQDPEKLSTTLPGLFTLTVSVGYGALLSYLFYLSISGKSFLLLWIFSISLAFLGALSLFFSIQKSKRIEFITSQN